MEICQDAKEDRNLANRELGRLITRFGAQNLTALIISSKIKPSFWRREELKISQPMLLKLWIKFYELKLVFSMGYRNSLIIRDQQVNVWTCVTKISKISNTKMYNINWKYVQKFVTFKINKNINNIKQLWKFDLWHFLIDDIPSNVSKNPFLEIPQHVFTVMQLNIRGTAFSKIL